LLCSYQDPATPISDKGSEVIFGEVYRPLTVIPANHAGRIKSVDLGSIGILRFKIPTFTPATGVRIPIAALFAGGFYSVITKIIDIFALKKSWYTRSLLRARLYLISPTHRILEVIIRKNAEPGRNHSMISDGNGRGRI
jgi:hypothetical protein